jgi:hypothetical protein
MRGVGFETMIPVICVIAIYRAPSGNFQYFFQNLDELLNMIVYIL